MSETRDLSNSRTGLLLRMGDPAQKLRPGDVVQIPP
jgi:hypothetical protein